LHVEDENRDGFWSSTIYGGWNYYNKSTNWAPGLTAISYDATNELKLISKLREKVYGSGFSPAVFLAESRQALGMISNSANRIASGLRRLKAGDGSGVCEALGIEPNKGFIRDVSTLRRSVSSLWLEVQYGWLPLLKDAEESARYLARSMVDRTPVPITVRKTWFEEKTGEISEPFGSGFARRIDIHELRLTMKAWSAAPVYQPNILTVAEVAWEKLPYSFVFDWFVPVGSLLNALKSQKDLQGVFIRSLKTTSVGLDWRRGPGYIGGYVSHLGLPDRKIWVDFNRTISTELYVPSFTSLISDDILAYRSWRHAANAVALLTQKRAKDLLGSKNATGWAEY
jgi:hypothetical protein